MNIEHAWDHYDVVRSLTLATLQATKEEQADIVPEGFSNNIRWNIGHVLFTQDALLYGGKAPHLPESYAALFGPGTKPADWQGELPTLETLNQQLAEQTERIKKEFADRFEEKLPSPFNLRGKAEIDTFGGMFLFSLYHEGMHASTVTLLRKALQNQA
ncbi:DinB family protein [Brevibacillus borstelensis]|uniref:DinB family protein n=1 Tax=Brevibacillus borstelensis TaxID=45462 RepID=UPI000F078FFC|nr:DinB family protein [Brevibacillus borstelensis]MED1881854.1 DinB family protein [Brevibacillus borstelensis]RNB62973.1 DinB family protein [Brevibacillus borstelensis]GED53373.1 formate dehydrogenase [Brevibacillus borstelensis]